MTDSEAREQFKKWTEAKHYDNDYTRWEAWQAGRLQGREEAARPKLTTFRCECGQNYLVEWKVIGKQV